MRLVKRTVLLIDLLLLYGFQIPSALARMDTLTTFPQKRFAGGVMDFGQYVASKFRYPLQAQQAAIVGTSLISFVLTPTGELTSVTVINSLGKVIDREMMRVIQQTNQLWLPADKAESQDSVVLFLPITLQVNDSKFYVEPEKPDFILDEAVVVAVIIISYNTSVNISFRDDAYYVATLSSAAQKKNYKQMLRAVDELIRRNPYSDRLYLQRAKVEQELGLTNEACRDLRKITDFLGKKHLPKQFFQNCS